MKAYDRIEELRRRHVAAVKRGIVGRIELRRIQHVEVALGEQRMRARGYKLHVIQNNNKHNFCPFLRREVPLISCMSRSVNHTEKVCFRCERPMEWAKASGALQEHDFRASEDQWAPHEVGRYVNGALVTTVEEPFAYQRVETPAGDVFFFKRYADGLVEPDYSSRPNQEAQTRWWNLGPDDMAPLTSSLPRDEVEQRAAAAERERTRLLRGATSEPKGDDEAAEKPKRKRKR